MRKKAYPISSIYYKNANMAAVQKISKLHATNKAGANFPIKEVWVIKPDLARINMVLLFDFSASATQAEDSIAMLDAGFYIAQHFITVDDFADGIGAIYFGDHIKLVSSVISDIEEFLNILSKESTESFSNSTKLWEAIASGIRELDNFYFSKNIHKVIIIFTDGVDTDFFGGYTFGDILDLAVTSNVIVYPILLRGETAGTADMVKLASETRGKCFSIGDYQQVGVELNNIRQKYNDYPLDNI